MAWSRAQYGGAGGANIDLYQRLFLELGFAMAADDEFAFGAGEDFILRHFDRSIF
jgi:hypothetical protein